MKNTKKSVRKEKEQARNIMERLVKVFTSFSLSTAFYKETGAIGDNFPVMGGKINI